MPLASLTFSILPDPDRLEGALSSGTGVLLISDGSSLSESLVRDLAARGAKVGLVYPSGGSAVDVAVYNSPLPALDEPSTIALVAAAAAALGDLTCIIYIQPAAMSGAAAHAALETAFLTARASQPFLSAGQHTGRPAFVAAGRIDGSLGLSFKNNSDPINAGLFGLVRSLSQEWPQVFCRAVDISPEIPVDQAVSRILAEIEDADPSYVEIGITAQGRQTPKVSALSVESK